LKYHMFEEIHEQPEVLATFLEEEWGRVVGVARTLRSRSFRFAILAAQCTSDNAALYAKYLFEVLLGVPRSLVSLSTFTPYETRMSLDDVLAVSISQSGESKGILETVSKTRQASRRAR
jgi:glutamine---fructose-6-phosphate transaminase (isomerizing)